MSQPPAVHQYLGGYAAELGFVLDETTPDRVTMSWSAPSSADSTLGLPVFASAVESVASIGASLWWGERGRCVGMSNSTTLFTVDPVGPFTALALPVDRGQIQQLWRVTITCGDGTLCASGEVLLANLAGSAA